jgi:hypothetical protein
MAVAALQTCATVSAVHSVCDGICNASLACTPSSGCSRTSNSTSGGQDSNDCNCAEYQGEPAWVWIRDQQSQQHHWQFLSVVLQPWYLSMLQWCKCLQLSWTNTKPPNLQLPQPGLICPTTGRVGYSQQLLEDHKPHPTRKPALLACIAKSTPAQARQLDKHLVILLHSYASTSSVLLQSPQYKRPMGASAWDAEANTKSHYTAFSLYKLTDFNSPPAVIQTQKQHHPAYVTNPKCIQANAGLFSPSPYQSAVGHRAECCACPSIACTSSSHRDLVLFNPTITLSPSPINAVSAHRCRAQNAAQQSQPTMLNCTPVKHARPGNEAMTQKAMTQEAMTVLC